MAVYTAIFFLSLLGIFFIIFRRRNEFSERCESANDCGEEINFAVFMEKQLAGARIFWHSNLKGMIFLRLEKNVRRLRILMLKAEKNLFKFTTHLRNISKSSASPDKVDQGPEEK